MDGFRIVIPSKYSHSFIFFTSRYKMNFYTVSNCNYVRIVSTFGTYIKCTDGNTDLGFVICKLSAVCEILII